MLSSVSKRGPAPRADLGSDSARVHGRLANLAQSELFGGLSLKRPEQHVTDSQGDAIFRRAFARWAANGSERDYGWDYVVEVFWLMTASD
jgi:hypothetical protein